MDMTDEQRELRKQIIEFAQATLNQDVVRRDCAGEFSRHRWKQCAEFGLQGLAVSEEYGGRDIDIVSATVAMEALGYGCEDNGLALGLSAQVWTMQKPVQLFGTDEQKQKYLPGFCDGSLVGAHAITEQESGSDAYALQLTAEPQDNGYVLNGRKDLITFAPVADMLLVFANVRPDSGKWGVTAFLVDRDTL